MNNAIGLSKVSHNLIHDVLVREGVMGLILFLWAVKELVTMLWRSANHRRSFLHSNYLLVDVFSGHELFLFRRCFSDVYRACHSVQMKFLYVTSAPSNVGGIAVIAEMLKADLLESGGKLAFNGFGQRSYIADLWFFLRHLFGAELVVLNTPILRRALLRDLAFMVLTVATRRKLHLCFHGGDAEKSSLFIDRVLVHLCKLMSSKYLYLGDSLIPAQDKSTKAGTFINPIELNPFSESYQPQKRIKKFLFMGRLISEKGVIVAIEILQTVAKRNPEQEMLFTIAGAGPLADILEDFTEGNLRVQFVGRVRGKEKLRLLAESDFFLLPSTFPEGMPMAILESAVARTVVVTSDRGAVCDYITDMETGRVLRGQQLHIASWVSAIEELVTNDELASRLRTNAYDKFSRVTNTDVINSFT